MYFRSISILLLAWLAGCTTAPELERQELPVPVAWPNDSAAGEVTGKVHWSQFFPDPHLQQLIRSALINNRDLRIAAARVEEARAQFGVARADRLPSLGLTGSGAFIASPDSLTTSVPPSERYDLGVSMLSYEVDFWGRLSALSESARFNLLSTEAARRAVQLGLVSDVANAYFTYLQTREVAEIARTSFELREQSRALVEQGINAGGAYDLEYQVALSLLENARSTLEGAEHQKNIAVNRLNFLIGNAMPKLPEGGALSAQGLDVNVAPGLPSEVLLSRPDVMAAEQRLRAAHANIGAARAAFLPKVLLTATAGLASQGLSSLFSGVGWAFQPSIAMPLFDGGRLAAGVDLAEARKVIAVAEYEKTIQQAFREVADLLSARRAASMQFAAAQANRRAQGKLLEIANARYSAGLTSYLDVLNAQREFVGASQAIVQVRRGQLDTATQLYRALGGGGEM